MFRVNFIFLVFQVLIEFESVCDADRLGVWYSLLKQATGHKLSRVEIPHSGFTSLRKCVLNGILNKCDLNGEKKVKLMEGHLVIP